MIHAAVIGKADEQLRAVLSGIENTVFQYSENADVLPDTACALIVPQEDMDLPAVCKTLKNRGIPYAALTFDHDDALQTQLLDSGIDRILLLPKSAELIRKHIETLAGKNAFSSKEFDLLSIISEPNRQLGAYAVSEQDFFKIFRFVQRLQERMDKQSQLVVFSFHTRLNTPVEPGTLEDAFPIVQRCLRRGDIASVCGKQITAILIGSDAEGAKSAIDRIVQTYEAHCGDSMYTIKYELREITRSV